MLEIHSVRQALHFCKALSPWLVRPALLNKQVSLSCRSRERLLVRVLSTSLLLQPTLCSTAHSRALQVHATCFTDDPMLMQCMHQLLKASSACSRLLARLDWSGLDKEMQDSLRQLAQLQCMAFDTSTSPATQQCREPGQPRQLRFCRKQSPETGSIGGS